MKEIVDRLSRDLALGVSRRKALWMFLAGSTTLGAFGSRKASASSLSLPQEPPCTDFCLQQAEQFLNLCTSSSANCPNGYCAEFTILAVNSNKIHVNGTTVYTLDETCTLVSGR
jgi:hypothetical protein